MSVSTIIVVPFQFRREVIADLEAAIRRAILAAGCLPAAGSPGPSPSRVVLDLIEAYERAIRWSPIPSREFEMTQADRMRNLLEV